jgi:uncharacterized membrane-anchored protein YitT (DUF2179 family)
MKRSRTYWETVRDYLYILAGAVLQAFSLRIFLVPANLASGGVTGITMIINHFTGWPIGTMVLICNIPLFILGWRFLGGKRFAIKTAVAVATYALLVDVLVLFLPAKGLTDDIVLNSLYGALLSGIGYGLVYRGQGTSGGSDILARILNNWKGISLSQSYLVVDGLVILTAGFVFGPKQALYALITLYVSGLIAETVLEGPSVVRTAMIVTAYPEQVAEKIMEDMGRGVTLLTGKGAYTGADRFILYCVVIRSEVPTLKAIIHEIDPQAFMVIGQAHEALGEGFKPLTRGGS